LNHHASRTRVLLAFAALYTIWGSTYLAIQVAGQSVPPLLMAGTRFLVAGSLLLAYCRVSGTLRPGDLNRRTWGAAATVAVGLMLIGNGGVALAVQRIPTGISAVIVALTPMWLVLFDWNQRRDRRPSNAVFIGIAFGIAGIATLKLAGNGTTDRLDLLGVAINIVATFGWAFGSIWGRTAPRPASPVTACALQMMAGGVILLAVSPFFEAWGSVDVTRLPAEFWWSWGYLIVFGSLCGFTAYIWLLQHVSAAKVGTYAYVNPIIALAIGVMLNGEQFTPTQAAACALILAGVIVITLFRSQSGAPQPTARAIAPDPVDGSANAAAPPALASSTEAAEPVRRASATS
jgi:drug/metabolite transporter (DMT)-like permease